MFAVSLPAAPEQLAIRIARFCPAMMEGKFLVVDSQEL